MHSVLDRPDILGTQHLLRNVLEEWVGDELDIPGVDRARRIRSEFRGLPRPRCLRPVEPVLVGHHGRIHQRVPQLLKLLALSRSQWAGRRHAGPLAGFRRRLQSVRVQATRPTRIENSRYRRARLRATSSLCTQPLESPYRQSIRVRLRIALASAAAYLQIRQFTNSCEQFTRASMRSAARIELVTIDLYDE